MLQWNIIVFCAVVSGTICTTLKPSSDVSIADTILSLKKSVNSMQERLLLLESKEPSDLTQKVKELVFASFQDVEKTFLEEKRQIKKQMEEIETQSRARHEEISDKLEKLKWKTTGQKEDTEQRLSNAEKSIEQLSERFQSEKVTSLAKEINLSRLLHEVQEKAFQAQEKIRRVEDQTKRALERERSKVDRLEIKENLTLSLLTSHITSQRDTEEIIRKNMTSLAGKLSLHASESSSLFEKMESDFTKKMRSLENSSLNFEKVSANISHVSKLDERLQNLEEVYAYANHVSKLGERLQNLENVFANASQVSMLDERLQNLEKTTSTDMRSIQNDILPRVKQLEERGDLHDDVVEMQTILRNYTSEINALERQYFDIQSLGSCADEPPILQNGKASVFDRLLGSNVRYECDRNFVASGNSTVRCMFGRWEGQPPVCSYFDSSFYAEASKTSFIDCHSDENADNITFSRVQDTGSGRSLPANTTQRVSSRSIGIGFDNVHGSHKYGVYQCGFHGKGGGSMNIILPVQYYGVLMYFPNPFLVANIGDTVRLLMHAPKSYSPRWKHNGLIVPTADNEGEVVIRNVQHRDEGIYSIFRSEIQGMDIALLRLIVRKCNASFYGEHCDKICPPCYNGGICHDHLGICVCPVGFNGNNCERACPEGYHGADCSTKCERENCKALFHCKPDPYGCSCARGFKGEWCEEDCETGTYGANCQQPCHCAYGPESCNRFTGACSGGCASGWMGESCQIKVLN